MLVLFKIFGLFVTTLTDDHKYSLLYRDILPEPIQILLSQAQNTFSQLLSAFLIAALNFGHFLKKVTLIADPFLKLASPKKVIT